MTARKLAERKIAAQTPTMPLPSTRHSPITENETRQLDMIRSSRITSRVDSLKSREVTPRGASRGQKGNGRRRNTGVKPLKARRRVAPILAGGRRQRVNEVLPNRSGTHQHLGKPAGKEQSRLFRRPATRCRWGIGITGRRATTRAGQATARVAHEDQKRKGASVSRPRASFVGTTIRARPEK